MKQVHYGYKGKYYKWHLIARDDELKFMSCVKTNTVYIFTDDIEDWFEENIFGGFTFIWPSDTEYQLWYFDSENDAMMFKLRYGG